VRPASSSLVRNFRPFAARSLRNLVRERIFGSPERKKNSSPESFLRGFVGSHIKRREPAKTPAPEPTRNPRFGCIGAMAAFHPRWIMGEEDREGCKRLLHFSLLELGVRLPKGVLTPFRLKRGRPKETEAKEGARQNSRHRLPFLDRGEIDAVSWKPGTALTDATDDFRAASATSSRNNRRRKI
jgi:hypothetical protein